MRDTLTHPAKGLRPSAHPHSPAWAKQPCYHDGRSRPLTVSLSNHTERGSFDKLRMSGVPSN